jgi:methyl-accepting chemotaxis protein
MKSKIIGLHILMLSSIGAVIAVSLLTSDIRVVGFFILIALVCLGFIFVTWMKLLRKVLSAYENVLGGNSAKVSLWSFSNIDKLEESYGLVAEKFRVSAELIGNLSNPEVTHKLEHMVANHPIGLALKKIKDELKELKQEESVRTWINEGLATFGEVLSHKTEIRQYTEKIITTLTKYLNANQGGLYIEQVDGEGRRYLELKACYAYERKKHVESKIFEGQGILGQCLLEKDFIFLTDVPKDYIKITSGLGFATPGNIVIAPLIFNGKFYGAIELALFQVLKPYQFEFLKKVSVSIASEIGAMKTLEHTQALFVESDALSKKLQTSEEEMKVNMEELAATQEEMSRHHQELEKKQMELKSFLSAIDNTIASVEFDLKGNITNANDIFLTITQYDLPTLRRKNYSELFTNGETVKLMWESLKSGKFFSGEFQLMGLDNKEQFLNGTFNPILDFRGVPYKIMMFAQFTTQEKEKLNELTTALQAFKATLPVIEFSASHQCKSANEKFLKMFNMGRSELRGKRLQDIIDNDDVLKIFDSFSNTEAVNGPHYLVTRLKIGDTARLYEISISLLCDLHRNVTRIIVMIMREAADSPQVRIAI